MRTDFIPTHRTNRPIGNIKSGSPIRVAMYGDTVSFSDILGWLGVKSGHIKHRYDGDDVRFWDGKYPGTYGRHVVPGDFIITDGEHFEVSGTDSGWDPIPAWKVGGEEEVSVTFHDTYYCIHGDATGTVLRVTPQELRSLAERIKDIAPEPHPIETARFIRARTKGLGEFRVLAKLDDHWYDHIRNEYTEDQVLDSFDEIEVIR